MKIDGKELKEMIVTKGISLSDMEKIAGYKPNSLYNAIRKNTISKSRYYKVLSIIDNAEEIIKTKLMEVI